jgi:hypothetical protein
VVTVGVIREIFQDVVESYAEDVRFFSRWSDVLDRDGSEHNPKALWRPPTVDILQEDAGHLTQQFTVAVAFFDDHASDRTGDQRDATYERMQIIAAHCWMRFHDLYVNGEATYQGVSITLEQVSNATFTPVWDSAGDMATGCAMQVTLSSPYQVCTDDYFT